MSRRRSAARIEALAPFRPERFAGGMARIGPGVVAFA